MATQVVLARERTAASRVVANVGLGAVRVVGSHMGLEVELPSKGTRALRALVLAAGVTFGRLVTRAGLLIGWDVGVSLGTGRDVLGRHITVDEARVGAASIVGRGLWLEIEAIGADVFIPGRDVKERVG